MDISVIVCTYNRAGMLKQALSSLSAMRTGGKFSYEIVVVDDASTDDTPEEVKEISRRIQLSLKYVRGEGHGVAAARNRGIEAASGQWLAFFDDDQLADPDWLLELWSLAQQTGALLVGGKRLLLLARETLQQLPKFTRALLGEEDYGYCPQKCGRKNTPSAGNALINRKVFERLGVFDESLVRTGEELDLYLRVRQIGLDVWYAPNAVCYHLVPPYRLKEDYLLWTTRRSGECFACRDFREWGRGKSLIAGMARLGQVFLINLPEMVFAQTRSDYAQALALKCRIWRGFAYFRGILRLLAPELLHQKDYLERLEFRKERSLFG